MAREANSSAMTVGGGEPRVASRQVKNKLYELYEELLRHDGYGEMHLEIRILRRGQKEVIIRCGKQYRYIIDYRNAERRGASRDVVSLLELPGMVGLERRTK